MKTQSDTAARSVPLHRFVLPFQRAEVGQWKARSDIRMTLEAIKQFADEAALCLAPSDSGERNLEQASRALNDLESMFNTLWQNRELDSKNSV